GWRPLAEQKITDPFVIHKAITVQGGGGSAQGVTELVLVVEEETRALLAGAAQLLTGELSAVAALGVAGNGITCQASGGRGVQQAAALEFGRRAVVQEHSAHQGTGTDEAAIGVLAVGAVLDAHAPWGGIQTHVEVAPVAVPVTPMN